MHRGSSETQHTHGRYMRTREGLGLVCAFWEGIGKSGYREACAGRQLYLLYSVPSRKSGQPRRSHSLCDFRLE